MEAATARIRRKGGVGAAWASLDSAQRRTVAMMILVVGGLHVAGFVILFALVAPSHYRLGGAGTLTIGIGITAYTLGMRHAFDADHISAIDNTTRKLMSEGKRPLSSSSTSPGKRFSPPETIMSSSRPSIVKRPPPSRWPTSPVDIRPSIVVLEPPPV